jgi:hypothetical protein
LLGFNDCFIIELSVSCFRAVGITEIKQLGSFVTKVSDKFKDGIFFSKNYMVSLEEKSEGNLLMGKNVKKIQVE